LRGVLRLQIFEELILVPRDCGRSHVARDDLGHLGALVGIVDAVKFIHPREKATHGTLARLLSHLGLSEVRGGRKQRIALRTVGRGEAAWRDHAHGRG